MFRNEREFIRAFKMCSETVDKTKQGFKLNFLIIEVCYIQVYTGHVYGTGRFYIRFGLHIPRVNTIWY